MRGEESLNGKRKSCLQIGDRRVKRSEKSRVSERSMASSRPCVDRLPRFAQIGTIIRSPAKTSLPRTHRVMISFRAR